MLTNTVTSCSLGTLQPKVLHPFGSTTGTDWFAFSLLFSRFATMLTPEFFFAFLTFLLQASDNVDWAPNMHVSTRGFLDCGGHSSRGNVGNRWTADIEILEKRVWSVR
jgi:hypothetical protein